MGILINPQGYVVFIGWKSIGNAMGIGWETAKKIAIKYGMPIIYLNGRPAISALELEIWFARLLLKDRIPPSIRKYKRKRGIG